MEFTLVKLHYYFKLLNNNWPLEKQNNTLMLSSVKLGI